MDSYFTSLHDAPRIAIEAVTPCIDDGRFPIKRIAGDSLTVEADVLMDGHHKLRVILQWRTAGQTVWTETDMAALGNDRWRAELPLPKPGKYYYRIAAWLDKFASYRDELEKKVIAGLDVTLELEEGRLVVQQALEHANAHDRKDLGTKLKAMLKPAFAAKSGKSSISGDFNTLADVPFKEDIMENLQRYPEINRTKCLLLLGEPISSLMQQADPRPFLTYSEPTLSVIAERQAAAFSSWYELFPRSQSGDANRHGTFEDVITRLPAIKAMGFDTIYFPPIHPIGRKNRKGRNNSLKAADGEPGSPYAIGSEEGGHDAIHPELGNWKDFRNLRDAAASHGLEIALDFAIQCAPDHPWLQQHPEWFDWRPDGSLRYAENPPKKYEDIVNVDFYNAQAIPDLWLALRDVVMLWASEGIRAFRVDNPHTKPFPFWEWLIEEVKAKYPDTLFLAEAFTTPKVMARLSKLGFTQSYTYFTWRNTKEELTEYVNELNASPVNEFFRPHFFVNTPDIHPLFLQNSGRPGFLIRAALASTLSGLWGISSGFELCEAGAVPDKEEFIDSEKYEIRAWDWQRPGNIIEEISQLNQLRKTYPALQTHLGTRFHHASNGQVLFYSKTANKSPLEAGAVLGPNEELILVVVNLDPHAIQETTLELPLYLFGIPDDGSIEVEDLLRDIRFTWYGKWHQFTLNPFEVPYGIWRISPAGFGR